MTSNITIILTIFKSVIGVLGIFFLIIAAIASSSARKKRKLCTEKLEARIADVECSESFSVDGYRADSWYPVYEYMVNGITMKRRSSVGHARKNFREGQNVVIYVNPENPDEFYSPEEKEGLIPKIFIGLGILLILLCILIIFLGF